MPACLDLSTVERENDNIGDVGAQTGELTAPPPDLRERKFSYPCKCVMANGFDFSRLGRVEITLLFENQIAENFFEVFAHLLCDDLIRAKLWLRWWLLLLLHNRICLTFQLIYLIGSFYRD